VAVAAAVGAAVAGSAAHTDRAATTVGAPAGALVVNEFDCGGDWKSAQAGRQTLTLYNDGTQTAEIYLVDPTSGAVFGEVVGLGPSTSDGMAVALGVGDYALRCIPADSDPVTGPTVHVGPVTGKANAGTSGGTSGDVLGPATAGVVAVTRADLTGPVKQYQDYVAAGLAKLLPLTKQVSADVAAGDLVAARADWVVAHQQYERLGGAYDAFGDLGDEIDGLPSGLAGGVTDPSFAGFHRVEYGLWHGESAASLTAPVSALVDAVTRLNTAFPSAQIDPLALGLRTHEILEDSVRFELSGQSDEGSGTSLATVSAQVDGTEALLGILDPILEPRYPDLAKTTAALDRLKTLLAAQHASDGPWTPLSQLTTAQREAVNSAAGAAVELLAPVATICEPRVTGS
jgi:iron uptake system component EfeO